MESAVGQTVATLRAPGDRRRPEKVAVGRVQPTDPVGNAGGLHPRSNNNVTGKPSQQQRPRSEDGRRAVAEVKSRGVSRRGVSLLAFVIVAAIGADASAQPQGSPPQPLPNGQSAAPAPAPAPAPTYTITLKSRHACVTPRTKKLARVDGGFIDVAAPSPQALVVTMTGTAAASSYLGCTGAATAEFELAQQIEITCSDPSVALVSLSLDSALVGFVRSKGHAGAAMRLAEVSITPEGWDGTPLTLWYPPFGVTGKDGRLCNQHLPPVQDVPMPIGRYVISARFALDTQAKGVCDDHSVADFSPDTTLPADWVRNRDPFQGVSKKSFGFTFTLSAAAPSASTAPLAGVARGSNPAALRSGNSSPKPPLDNQTRKTASN
jgi:hypothetical protein